MGLFDFLFGRKYSEPEQPEAAPAVAAPAPQGNGGSVDFDAELTAQLKEEHRSLLAVFTGIKKAYQAQDFAGVTKGLQQFQTALNMHLAVENFKFYSYLRRNLKNGSPELATMNSFFDEMQEIGKVVSQFLRKYLAASFTQDIQQSFGRELEAIGAALMSRIDREEETLYRLYQPS